MSESRTTNRATPRAALVAGAVVLALLVVGARQLTVQLAGDGPDTAAAAAGAEAGAGSPPAAAGIDRPASPAEADGATGGVVVGEVVVDETFAHNPRPDQITIEPAATARAADDLPDQSDGGTASGAGSDDDTALDQPGPVGEASGSTADAPIGTVDSVLDLRVGTTGHVATVVVKIGPALDGLTALSVDFGDGSVLRLDDRQLASLVTSGRLRVVHEYVPTLTPQPQRVRVVATDGAGQSHDRTVDFATRAEYRLTYSALEVTALDDCDLAGKGDFTLTWRLDSRPARTSDFTLGKGERYQEERFRIGITGVHYDEPLEHFLVRVEENDPGPGSFTPEGFSQFSGGGPVFQPDNHHYQVTMHADDVENAGPAGSSLHWDCDVDLTFTAYVTMIDSPDRR